MKRSGIGSHTSPNQGATDDWISPKYLIDRLGPFDLDPCRSLTQPWPCARRGYTVREDGLSKRWRGRVWLNAPYSRNTDFLCRMAEHSYGVALLFGRTETAMFREHIWKTAKGLLFLDGRLHFHFPDAGGKAPCESGRHVWEGRPENPKTKWCSRCGQAKGNSGGPSVLVAYSDEDVECLRDCGLSGALVTGWEFCNG